MDHLGLARVYVVVVHHRGKEMLEACLESLLASHAIDLQIVVVLNHCQEDVPALALSSKAIHLVKLGHSHGFGEANNLGIDWARRNLGPADYYYFVNNDTVSRKDTLGLLVDELEAAPDAAIAGPQTLIESAPDFINSLGLNVTEDAWGWDEGIGIALSDYGPLPGVRRVMAVTGSALLIKADMFEEIGGWSEVYDYYFEDIDLGIKVWKQGREVLHVPESVIFHRVSATMTTGAERKFYFFWRNRLLLAAIHWPLGMLFSVLRRAVFSEVLNRPWSDSSLQRRALVGALRKVPLLVRERFRQRGDDAWRRFLHPAGSVPRITLPQPGQLPAGKAPAATPKAELRGTGHELEAANEAAAAEQPKPAIDETTLERLRQEASEPAGRKRLLILGWSPLPFENERMNYAPGTRSWQFAAPLAADGHKVCLVCAAIPGATFEPPAPCRLEVHDGVVILRLGLEILEDAAELARIVEAFAPAAVIGAAPGPSVWAAEAAGDLPLWCDFFGDPMAEGQAREAIYPGLQTYGAYAGQVARLLRRGDAFSAVSQRQRLALVGQLGLAGRLRGEAAGHEFVHVLPCAAEPAAPAGKATSLEPAQTRAEAEDFLVVWSGGFNTWCDVRTLVAGLEAAMDLIPGLQFMATGGRIKGHDDRTEEEMRALIAASRHAKRFTLLGHVAREEAEALLARAQLTLITEKKLYERELGSSGRIAGFLAGGKAILCANCSEQALELAAEDLLLTYQAGDPKSLGEQLILAAQSPERLRDLSLRARAFAEKNLTYAATTGALRAWASKPQKAPDVADVKTRFLVGDELTSIDLVLEERNETVTHLRQDLAAREREKEALEEKRQELEEHQAHLLAELRAEKARFHQVRGELGDIHQSRMWRLWMHYFSARQWLRGLLGLRRAE